MARSQVRCSRERIMRRRARTQVLSHATVHRRTRQKHIKSMTGAPARIVRARVDVASYILLRVGAYGCVGCHPLAARLLCGHQVQPWSFLPMGHLGHCGFETLRRQKEKRTRDMSVSRHGYGRALQASWRWEQSPRSGPSIMADRALKQVHGGAASAPS